MKKTQGQLDYEKDVKKNPYYGGKYQTPRTPRVTWAQLPPWSKETWERPAKR